MAWAELQYTVESQIHLLLINCYIRFRNIKTPSLRSYGSTECSS